MTKREDYIADGIEQLETPVPKWWKTIFIGLLAVSPMYMLYYHIGAPGRSMADEYDSAVDVIARKKYAEIGSLTADEATIVRFMEKPNWLKVGKGVFKKNCVTCHGRGGEGNVGPNLTDEKFKNIEGVADIAKVILKGANNNAMPAWEEKLDGNDVVMLSAYVASLRGTNASGGKAAEGREIAPWPVAADLAPAEPVSPETEDANESTTGSSAPTP